MKITRKWFAEQMRRVATLAADPSSSAQEHNEARLHVIEASIASILERLDEKESE
jgi:hypothetical protein